jgi:hypothetical protein
MTVLIASMIGRCRILPERSTNPENEPQNDQWKLMGSNRVRSMKLDFAALIATFPVVCRIVVCRIIALFV